ncbi:MAG: nucleotide exchange factor GrpE [Pseudomonadota bacterium]
MSASEAERSVNESGQDVGDEAAPDGGEPTAGDPVDALAEAERKASEHWDKYLRAVAELDNVRKRAQRDVEKAHKFAIERFAGDLLSVADSLSMGIEAAGDGTVDSLREGSEATLKLLNQVFERFGVEAIDPEGEPFDPERHEAMTMQPSHDVEPGSVLAVVQRGYSLNGRLLRPARVIVAAAPAEGA